MLHSHGFIQTVRQQTGYHFSGWKQVGKTRWRIPLGVTLRSSTFCLKWKYLNFLARISLLTTSPYYTTFWFSNWRIGATHCWSHEPRTNICITIVNGNYLHLHYLLEILFKFAMHLHGNTATGCIFHRHINSNLSIISKIYIHFE